MAANLQQQVAGHASISSGNRNATFILPSVPLAKSLLVAIIYNTPSVAGPVINPPTGITGGGVTWINAVSTAADTYNAQSMWYGYNASGSGTTSIVVTIGGTYAGTVIANISEYTGVTYASDPKVNTNSAVGGTGTSIATAGSVTTTATDLVVSGVFDDYFGTISSVDNSFQLLTGNNNGPEILGGAYNTQGGVQANFSLSSYSNHWSALILNFTTIPAPPLGLQNLMTTNEASIDAFRAPFMGTLNVLGALIR